MHQFGAFDLNKPIDGLGNQQGC
ncbi:hypothetical protein VAS14_22984 [Vibrio angustum S14]|uniref:Uncharacterized protein n=1 Tax=Photobacterium angustum (strain S14 / CCUG 15956) TaxID=314292 RepID=Q1ZL78_PHOAS|nr:hypothetical protein VAS14_22984 [Vibrio angustum S14] [Photobacterium angustum S14]